MQAASGHRSLFVALVVSALSFVPLEQSQAQLIIDVYPSQDHTNQTLWIADAQLLRRDDRQPTMGYIGAKVCAVVVVDEDANLGWQAF